MSILWQWRLKLSDEELKFSLARQHASVFMSWTKNCTASVVLCRNSVSWNTLKYSSLQSSLIFSFEITANSFYSGIMFGIWFYSFSWCHLPSQLTAVGAARSGPLLVRITIIISGCNMISAWIWFITFWKEMKGKGYNFVYYEYSNKH